MIRTMFCSDDRNLQLLLSSALGEEFEISLAPDWTNQDRSQAVEDAHIRLIDLDSGASDLERKIARARDLVASGALMIVMADDDLRQASEELVGLGAFRFCRKPPSIRDLRIVLRSAHESLELKRRLKVAEERLKVPGAFAGMVGSSRGMRQVFDLIRRVADVNAPVLIAGESGVGKELVAGAIHQLSTRADRPFVAVSCGAIPETLIEAELFGHEKGAYTGTTGAREGYFEQASNGTLFLDEIGELHLSTQVKLLRALQQREFNRLGSTRVVPLRSRLVFATNSDLGEMVEEGKFRTDLFYRINVIKITVPPLRERTEDIAALARHFLTKYSELYGKRVDVIEPEAMAAIEAYAWPGNIRELENVIQRAIIVAADDRIALEDMPADLQEEGALGVPDLEPAGSFEGQLRDYKIRIANAAVRDNKGNKTLAARQLHISRAYLHRLIRLGERIPAVLDGGRGPQPTWRAAAGYAAGSAAK